jgi:adenine-specific DNA-methyltransferase
MSGGVPGDPQFTFILCRTGTNRNGDHFTAEELAGRHMTVVNKKVDLQHSQEFSDIEESRKLVFRSVHGL